MNKQILIIHGGNAFETYEQYLEYLRNKKFSLEKIKRRGWKDHLGEVLGAEYDVLAPLMPNGQNARYLEWSIWFEKIFSLLEEPVILIGHSLGALFLIKYLSENDLAKKVKATMLISPPFYSAENHLADFMINGKIDKLQKQGGEIYLYQSKDDKAVPFSDFEKYAGVLPTATKRVFEDRGHFQQAKFPELVEDIKSLG